MLCYSIFRCWGLVGQDCFGNFWLSQLKCGGLLIWSGSHYSGKFYSTIVFCYLQEYNYANLVHYQCSALHERQKRPKGGTTRTQFFLMVLISGLAYYVVPGYLFSMLTSFSWICWLAPKSILVQQLGSGLKGLGIGAFGLDWSTISSYLGSPLASPWFATADVVVGFILCMFEAKNFPIVSNKLFMGNGSVYNISTIVDSNFHLDRDAYAKNGPLHLSTFFAMSYGLGFATLSATVMHVLLLHGRLLLRKSSDYVTNITCS